MVRVAHNRLTYGDEDAHAVAAVVRSGQWAGGPQVRRLESELAGRAGVAHAVCVASGTAALRLALRAVGIRPGGRVLVPAYCCVALPNAVLACGAVPMAVDVRVDDWNICPEAAARAAEAHGPRAAVAVHTFGAPAPIDALRRLGIPLVEDCAHAFGMSAGLRPLGACGDVAVISLYATKLIGAGEGGAVLTDSAAVADFVRDARDYADKPPAADRGNDKMTDLEASLALCQLQRLDDMLRARAALAGRYGELLAAWPRAEALFRLPRAGAPRVWYRYAVEVLRADADAVIAAMSRKGVDAARPVTDWRGPESPPCPAADGAYRRVVSLPLYPSLTWAEQEAVVAAFLSACEGEE